MTEIDLYKFSPVLETLSFWRFFLIFPLYWGLWVWAQKISDFPCFGDFDFERKNKYFPLYWRIWLWAKKYRFSHVLETLSLSENFPLHWRLWVWAKSFHLYWRLWVWAKIFPVLETLSFWFAPCSEKKKTLVRLLQPLLNNWNLGKSEAKDFAF